MLRRCHITTWPQSLVLALFPASIDIVRPLLSLFTTSKPSLLLFNTWENSIQAGNSSTRPAKRTNSHRNTQKRTYCGQPLHQYKMDSMPIRTLSVTDLDRLKISEPETKTQHVEHVNAPATVEEHRVHLPRGLSQTEEEKASHWFIGSIDCGTTSSRFLIFDGEGTPISSHQIEFDNIYPESG